MRVFVLIVFFLCIGLELVKTKYKFSKKEIITLYILILIALIVAAGLRDGFHGYRDYANYVDLYLHEQEEVEVSFNVIANLSKWIAPGNYYVLFMIYALLGVTAKSIGIFRLTPFVFASLAMYVAHYYSLHELTQIRAGVAAGLGLIAVKEIYDKNWIKYLMWMSLAVFFHISAIIYLPLFFLRGDTFNKTVWIGGSILAIVVIKSLTTLLFSSILEYGEFVARGETLQGYANNSVMGKYTLDVTSKFYLLSYVLCGVYAFLAPKIQAHNRYFYILLKIYIISIVFRTAFVDALPVVALRCSELFDVVFIALFPMLIYVTRPRSIGVSVVGLIGLSYLYRIMFAWGLIP